LVIPHLKTPKLSNYSDWDQITFNLNLVMACTNSILSLFVSKYYKPYSLIRFDSNNRKGAVPTLQASSEWEASSF